MLGLTLCIWIWIPSFEKIDGVYLGFGFGLALGLGLARDLRDSGYSASRMDNGGDVWLYLRVFFFFFCIEIPRF